MTIVKDEDYKELMEDLCTTSKDKKIEYVKVCPNCKSTDIDYATQLGGANMGGGDHFYCKTCDHGRFHHVIFDKKKKIVNRSKAKKSVKKANKKVTNVTNF